MEERQGALGLPGLAVEAAESGHGSSHPWVVAGKRRSQAGQGAREEGLGAVGLAEVDQGPGQVTFEVGPLELVHGLAACHDRQCLLEEGLSLRGIAGSPETEGEGAQHGDELGAGADRALECQGFAQIPLGGPELSGRAGDVAPYFERPREEGACARAELSRRCHRLFEMRPSVVEAPQLAVGAGQLEEVLDEEQIGTVEERASQLQGPAQRRDGLLVLAAAPVHLADRRPQPGLDQWLASEVPLDPLRGVGEYLADRGLAGGVAARGRALHRVGKREGFDQKARDLLGLGASAAGVVPLKLSLDRLTTRADREHGESGDRDEERCRGQAVAHEEFFDPVGAAGGADANRATLEVALEVVGQGRGGAVAAFGIGFEAARHDRVEVAAEQPRELAGGAAAFPRPGVRCLPGRSAQLHGSARPRLGPVARGELTGEELVQEDSQGVDVRVVDTGRPALCSGLA